MRSLVGVDGRAGLDNSMDGLDPIAFMLADEREHVAVTLAHDHDRLALARLIGEKATIATVCLVIGRLYIAAKIGTIRSEEHTSELQSLMRISYAVFCLTKKHIQHTKKNN